MAEQTLTAGLFQQDFLDEDDEEDDDGNPLIGVGLDATVLRRLGMVVDKTLQTSFIGAKGPLTPEQIEYALKDARLLLPLAKRQRAQLTKDGLNNVWVVEEAVTPLFLNMSARGILLDPSRHQPLIEEATVKRDAVEGKLMQILTPLVLGLRLQKYDEQMAKRKAREAAQEAYRESLRERWRTYDYDVCDDDLRDETPHKESGEPMGMRRFVAQEMKPWNAAHKPVSEPKMDHSPINLNSPQQLSYALNEGLGLGLESTGKKILKGLLPNLEGQQREVVAGLLDFRREDKFLNSFGVKLLDSRDEGGRVYGTFRQYGTLTGRPTCRDHNFLQIPGKSAFRRPFVADPGTAFIVCDYSQMELRLVAELSQDSAMVRAFQGELDLHTETARLMFRIDGEVPTEKRKIAKIINFGILYGMGPGKLRQELAAEGVFLSEQETRDALDSWHAAYRVASQWIKDQQQRGLRRGYTETPLGRKRRFLLKPEHGQREKGIAMRAAGNFPIQGSCADCAKIAMVLIHDLVSPVGGELVLNVYDEIVTQVPIPYAKWAKEVVRESMISAAQTVLKTVPAKVDAVISHSWSEEDVFSDEELEGS